MAGIWSPVGGGVFVNMPPRWRWSVSKPGLLIHRAVIADVHVVKNSSVVTITELSPPPRWLATMNLTVFWRCCFLKTAPHYRRAASRLNAASFDPAFTHGDTALLPPRVCFPTRAIRSAWPAVQIALISFTAWSQRSTRLNSTRYDHGFKL